MTKEIIIESSNTKETNNKKMSTLDKVIIIWFIAKAIDVLVLLYKRYAK